jgi:hypothetical protein
MTAIEINTLLLHTIVAAVVLCTCLGWFLYLREIAKPYSLGHHNTPILVGFAGFCAGTGVAVGSLMLVVFVVEAFLRGTGVVS